MTEVVFPLPLINIAGGVFQSALCVTDKMRERNLSMPTPFLPFAGVATPIACRERADAMPLAVQDIAHVAAIRVNPDSCE
jgi:hypothetical protein